MHNTFCNFTSCLEEYTQCTCKYTHLFPRATWPGVLWASRGKMSSI